METLKAEPDLSKKATGYLVKSASHASSTTITNRSYYRGALPPSPQLFTVEDVCHI